MKVRVDRDRCAGAGQCVFTAEGVFDQDDIGIVVIIDGAPATVDDVDAAAEAARLCPSGAITVAE